MGLVRLVRGDISKLQFETQKFLSVRMLSYGYGSIAINTIFRGMNIHKSQLFWCELGVQGFDTLPYRLSFDGSALLCHAVLLPRRMSIGALIVIDVHAKAFWQISWQIALWMFVGPVDYSQLMVTVFCWSLLWPPSGEHCCGCRTQSRRWPRTISQDAQIVEILDRLDISSTDTLW